MGFYITPKLYKKSEFWRDMCFYNTPKLNKGASELVQEVLGFKLRVLH